MARHRCDAKDHVMFHQRTMVRLDYYVLRFVDRSVIMYASDIVELGNQKPLSR